MIGAQRGDTFAEFLADLSLAVIVMLFMLSVISLLGSLL